MGCMSPALRLRIFEALGEQLAVRLSARDVGNCAYEYGSLNYETDSPQTTKVRRIAFS